MEIKGLYIDIKTPCVINFSFRTIASIMRVYLHTVCIVNASIDF